MANNTSKKGLGLTQGNKNTHIFTEFEQMNKESTQLQVLEAIKQIQINVGDIIVGDISVESNDTGTHTRLETINTTITDKHLDSTSDSVTVSGTVSIDNEIIVVDTIDSSINDAPYDLLINGPTLWADSTPLVNPFFADANGREGWYYDNFSNIANVSNIYWYANPVSGNLQENDMTFAQLSGMYTIITPDYVENGALTNPIMAVYSQPTGTNDFIPGFAHSRWSYSLTNTNIAKLRKAETIMLYTGSTRPNVHLNIPAYPLVLASTSGDGLSSEIVAYMTVNTQATTSKIGYLLQYTGFLNSAIGFNREFQFKNSKDRIIQNNQYSNSVNATITGTPSVNATITGTPSVNATITGTPSVNATITGTPSVNATITGTPSVNATITGTPSVNATITGTPDVNATLVGSPSVTISGTPSVNATITGTPSVNATITGTPSVNATITGTPAVSIYGYDGTNTNFIRTNTNGELLIGNISIPVEGTVSIDALPSIDAGTNSIQIFGDNGTNNVAIRTNTTGELRTEITNQISGYALESGGNLASIKTNTDRIKSDTTNHDAIQVQVKNSSIDTHCYASSNGTAWHHLASDSNGQLNVHSKTQDGAGNDITSTVVGTTRGLDVNIIGGGGGGGGGLVQIQDSDGNTLSAVSSTVPQLRTTIYSASGAAVGVRPVGSTYANSLDTYNKVLDDNNFSGTGIKTVPQLFITGSSPNQYTTPRINGVGDQYVTLSTNSGGNTVQFDNSTANGNKIKIDSATGNNIVALATGANTVKIDSTTNTVKIDSTTNTIKIGDGTYTANVLPTIANIQNAEGLVCDSALYAFNTSSGEVQPLTVNLNGNKNQLEVRDNDAIVELTSIDNKLLTTTPYSVAGLNVYPIYPKKIHYTLMGRSEATVNAVIMGGSGSQRFYYELNFGLANPQTFSAVQTGGVLRTIKYHYVNDLGVLKTDGTATFSALNSVVTLQPTNMISINKFWIDGAVGVNEQVVIRIGTANNSANTIASADVDDYYNGVITVPNGYIGYLTNFSLFTPSPAFVFVLKWDALGNRSVVFNHYNSANAPIPSGANGSIGGIFTAGESIAFGKSAVGASVMCGNFVLEPI